MKIMQKITIDLTRHAAAPVVDAVQGDSVRWVGIELLSNGEVWKIPKDARVVVSYCNAVGEGDSYTTLRDDVIAWSAKKNILTIALTEEVCALHGDTKLQITLLKESQQLSTFAIVVRVQKRVEANEKPQRPVHREGYVTPQMFGAVGNGAADDTDAIRMARDVAAAEKKALYFPAGTYLVRGHIALWNDCEIYGEGSRTVIKKRKANSEILKPSGIEGTFAARQQAFVVNDGNKYHVGDDFYFGANRETVEGMRGRIVSIDNNIVTIEGYATNRNADYEIEKGLPERLISSVNDKNATVVFSTTFPVFNAVRHTEDGEWNAIGNVHIHDLTIDGDRRQDEVKSYAVSAIHFDALKVFSFDYEQVATISHENIRLDHLHICNSPADGISVQSAKNVCVTDCYLERCSHSGVHFGFGTVGGSITGCKLCADGYGYYDGDGVHAVSLSNNHFEECVTGVGGMDVYTRGLSINSNTFRGCEIGICADSAMDQASANSYNASISGIAISNNTFFGTDLQGVGISFANAGGGTVSGNAFRDLAVAIQLGKAYNVCATNNVITDCASPVVMGANSQSQLAEDAVTSDSAFVNNLINAVRAGASAGVLISFAENMRIGGNVVTGINAGICIDKDTTSGIVDEDKAVRFEEQNLTEEQKEQVRVNIGVSSKSDNHAAYFTITEDGVLSLKPEFRGESTDNTYPAAVSDEGVGETGSRNVELPEHLVIPENMGGIAVNSIADGAFAYNTVIKSVAFPKTVDTIPDSCFRDCHCLEKVTNTENIKAVGDSAFRKTNIQSADFPNLETLGEYAFFMCSCLTHVNLGKTTSIGGFAFAACNRLSSVKSDDLVTSVGRAAFCSAHSLVNVSFVKNLTYIGDGAFIGCPLDYDWSLLQNCEFGTNATPLQWNDEDFWSGCAADRSENPIPTLLCQHDPRWKNRPIGGIPKAKTYGHGCTLFSMMHAYCGLNDLHLSTVFEFEDIVNEIVPGILSNYEFNNDLEGTQIEDAALLAEALGLAVTSCKEFNSDTLQALYDALASGKYVLLTASNGFPTDPNAELESTSGLTGHATLAYGLTSNGKIRIADSSENYRTDPSKGGYLFKLPAKVACYNIDHDSYDLPMFWVLENPMMSYYGTLIDAVNDANEGTIGANANADESSAVVGAYISSGKPYLTLLKDAVEAARIEPSVDMTINLGGHKLSANNAVCILVQGGNLTIDGRRPGSAIMQMQENNAICVQTSTNGTAQSVTVLGGVYSSEGSKAAHGFYFSDPDATAVLSGCEITNTCNGTDGSLNGIFTRSDVTVRNCTISMTAPDSNAIGVNVAKNSNVDVQMNNCRILGSAKTFTAMQLATGNDEQNNAIYVSNSEIAEGSVISIGDETHKLCIGKGNNFTADGTDRPGSVVTTDEEYAQ